MLDYRMDTFLQLYKQMNYRKTAEALGMTQPGVTQHIQYLEQHYGVKLFLYDGRQLRRTPQAEALKKHIDGVLARERSLRQILTAPHMITSSIGLHMPMMRMRRNVIPGNAFYYLALK